MNGTILWSLLVCLVGLVVYVIATAPAIKTAVAELARIAYAMGLLVTLLYLATKVVKF